MIPVPASDILVAETALKERLENYFAGEASGMIFDTLQRYASGLHVTNVMTAITKTEAYGPQTRRAAFSQTLEQIVYHERATGGAAGYFLELITGDIDEQAKHALLSVTERYFSSCARKAQPDTVYKAHYYQRYLRDIELKHY